jgi:predicted Mrr-cat superfamily restriction endonuclease
MPVWVVRAGQGLPHLEDFLASNRVALAWGKFTEQPDWHDKQSVDHALRATFSDATTATIANWSGQHWRFLNDVSVGDFVITPGEAGKALYVGRIAGPARESDNPDYSLERAVNWRDGAVSSDAFDADIRSALGSIMTFFAPRTQGIEKRFEAVLDGQPDPGADSVPTESSNAWVFQANPKRYNLSVALDAGTDDNWSVNQNRKRVHPGDRVWFRLSGAGDGRGAGIYAVGRIVSEVSDTPSDFGKWSVEVQYESRVEPPLLMTETNEDGILGATNALKGTMGTNFRLSIAEDAQLEECTSERLEPVAGTNAESRLAELQLHKDVADLRAKVLDDILEALRALDHKSFEHVCASYLEALGCKEVHVTGAVTAGTLGDGGIDVTGVLDRDGLPAVRVRVQAKNQVAGVGPSTITQLRGSLSPGTYGMVITTAHFTKAAMEEANRPDLAHIRMVDGKELAHVLADNGIGASTQTIGVMRFDAESIAAAAEISVPEVNTAR